MEEGEFADNLLEQPVRCRVREAVGNRATPARLASLPRDCPVGRYRGDNAEYARGLLALSPPLHHESANSQQQDEADCRDDDNDVLCVPVAATRRGHGGKRYQRHSRQDCLSTTAQRRPTPDELAGHHQRPSIISAYAFVKTRAAVRRASPCRRRPPASGPSPCPRPRRGSAPPGPRPPARRRA